MRARRTLQQELETGIKANFHAAHYSTEPRMTRPNSGSGYNRMMLGSPIKVLLQTTIPTTADDWCIARFSLLGQFLREQRRNGAPLFEVTMRDRESLGAPDSVLSTLADAARRAPRSGRYGHDQYFLAQLSFRRKR